MSNRKNGSLQQVEQEEADEVRAKVLRIRVCDIESDPEQPRQTFDEDSINELAVNLKDNHQVVPIVVRRHKDNRKRFILVAGERRWRAHKIAGIEKIDAIEREFATELDIDKESIIENVGREDVNDIDLARKFRKMKDKHGLTTEELAKLVCKPKAAGWIAQRLTLLNLDKTIQARLNPKLPDGERISFSVGLSLASFEPEHQLKFISRILSRNMSLKAINHMLRMATVAGEGKVAKQRSPSKDLQMVDNTLRRFYDDMELYMKMGGTMFDRAFSNQSRTQRRNTLARIQQAADNLQTLKEAIEDLPVIGKK